MTNYEQLLEKEMENPQFVKAFQKARLERTERGRWEKFQHVLKKVPDVEPEEFDPL